ncbi:GNAT family N-acetyltransferase [Brevibacterium sp. 239c]|uniref:GNAT family N-acetyltransferase n=1 Tax=Brevibacterium sp. 239c TaxID=1965356 RepID=UPI002153568B|nr:GNAT family N-acetyltransferase [Brevibacterium sp. 239c]
MSPNDLDDLANLLGDPQVMEYYPRPKDRPEAAGWINWNLRSYADHGQGSGSSRLMMVNSSATAA